MVSFILKRKKMTSVNKFKKARNSFNRSALKDKLWNGIKRISFYHASNRQQNKKIKEEDYEM